MTDQPKNPFRPGAGLRPVVLAGRLNEQRLFTRSLDAAPELPANIWITGLRGVGKTVLLKELEQVALDRGWVTARAQVEPRHNTERCLTELVSDLALQAAERVSRTARLRGIVGEAIVAARGMIRLTYESLELSLSPTLQGGERSVARSLFDASAAAVGAGSPGFLLMLDEAQVLRDSADREGEHPLSLLVAALNALQELDVPVALVLCGLPTLRAHLVRARTYSERMFRGLTVDRLEAPFDREAFARPFAETGLSASDRLVDRVIGEVEGYPFFIQIWGAELWDAARAIGARSVDEALLDAITPDIYKRLDLDFYQGRLDVLTPAERDLLASLGGCPYPPLHTEDVQVRSQKSVGNVNVLMGRLVEQGVLYRLKKGTYDYTAPRFHEYLRRRAGA